MVRRTLLILAGIASGFCSLWGVLLLLGAGDHPEYDHSWALVFLFPALSFPMFLAFLRWQKAGTIGSWGLFLGAFLSHLFSYRHYCHTMHVDLNAGMMHFVYCTILLAWHLRIMLGVALCASFTPPAEWRPDRSMPEFEF